MFIFTSYLSTHFYSSNLLFFLLLVQLFYIEDIVYLEQHLWVPFKTATQHNAQYESHSIRGFTFFYRNMSQNCGTSIIHFTANIFKHYLLCTVSVCYASFNLRSHTHQRCSQSKQTNDGRTNDNKYQKHLMKINPSTKNATHNLQKLIRNMKWFYKFW